jgi:hypothetical protein
MKGNIEIRAAKEANSHLGLGDNGGRRSGIDRRNFCYAVYIPERRVADRRSGPDRRCDQDWMNWRGRRNGIDRKVYLNTVRLA